MKILPKLLFLYSAVAAFLITASSVLTSNTIGPVIFSTLFLPVTAYFVVEFFKELRSVFTPTTSDDANNIVIPKKGETIIIFLIFLILFGVGLRNILFKKDDVNETNNLKSPNTPIVLKSETTPTPTPAKTLSISITDGAPSVNVRGKPSLYSSKIADAKNGDTFEYTKRDGEWYEIKLKDETYGYISFKYVVEK